MYKHTGNTNNQLLWKPSRVINHVIKYTCINWMWDYNYMLRTSFIDLNRKLYIGNRKFWLRYKHWNLRFNLTLGEWKMIRNSRKFAINKFAINVEKMYRLCTFLAGELQKLRNKRKFAISVFVISEFYCKHFWGFDTDHYTDNDLRTRPSQ